ncbi:hypothetical protein J2S97_004293 [Arthrobacter oryzae]|nr:hypothetical protein [Arthrobacter oryzae]
MTKQVLTMSRADILISGADQAEPSTEGHQPDG